MAQFAGYNPNMLQNPAFIGAQGYYPNNMQPNFMPSFNQNQAMLNMMRQGQQMPNGYQQMNNSHPGMNGQRPR